MLSANLLQRLASGWNKRARVRSPIDLDISFDLEKEDFLVELLPFKEHPFFLNASPKIQSMILSCGWIAYNAKTVSIETDVVHPLCREILDDRFNNVSDFMTKQLITETLVDESYHIHLCIYGNEITKQHRNIHLQLPLFKFIKKMRQWQDQYPEKWKKSIIQLVTAITSEIYITDYLALVSKAKTHSIQPLNSLLVQTHRSDELVHGKIFTHLAHLIFNGLNQQQKEFFAEMMPKPIIWLSDMEYEIWFSILEQIKFPYPAKQMINECKESNGKEQHEIIHSNQGTADLIHLAKELGVLDFAIGEAAFDVSLAVD